MEALYEQVHLKESDTELPQPKRKKEETAMSFLLGTEWYGSLSVPTWKEEFEQFQKEPQLHHDEDALLWWRANEPWFPTLG